MDSVLGLTPKDISVIAGGVAKASVHRWKNSGKIANKYLVEILDHLEIEYGIIPADLAADDVEERFREKKILSAKAKRRIEYMERSGSRVKELLNNSPAENLAIARKMAKAAVDQFDGDLATPTPESATSFFYRNVSTGLENLPFLEAKYEGRQSDGCYVPAKDSLNHISGNNQITSIPNLRLLAFIQHQEYIFQYGISAVEINELIHANLPEWCCSPAVLLEMIKELRRVKMTGEYDIKLKTMPPHRPDQIKTSGHGQ